MGDLESLAIPFPRASSFDRVTRGNGLCLQGNNGPSTHVATLAYAVDFRLPIGTPILAARAGIVAAVASHFIKGGLDAKYRPRANFVAVQHSDGSYARYFHLRHNGVSVKKGDNVAVGDQLGISGNTGFSSTPHLHFDVVDVLPEDTCRLEIVNGIELEGVAAAFSAALPAIPLRLEIIEADPPNASTPLKNAERVKGKAVFIDRGGCSFTTKVKNAILAEVGCMIVSNSQEGPELFSMGGMDKPVDFPSVLISKESGVYLRRMLENSEKVELSLSSSDGYRLVTEKRKGTPKKDQLLYVANTLPSKFKEGDGESYVPREGLTYPLSGTDTTTTPEPYRGCCSLM